MTSLVIQEQGKTGILNCKIPADFIGIQIMLPLSTLCCLDMTKPRLYRVVYALTFSLHYLTNPFSMQNKNQNTTFRKTTGKEYMPQKCLISPTVW